jgi:hypothetical protein
VLNNVVLSDSRIPPYGFDRDAALARSALPVPASRFGDPAPGGFYEHFDTTGFTIPGGAAHATVRLLYQQTSWEYVQFLWLANDGANAFLGATGQDLLDAWLNTGMAAPFEMSSLELPLVSQGDDIFADGFESGDATAWSSIAP